MAGPPPVNFGEELKDSFKPVNAWVANGIAWLDDIQAFYRERAVIEKEYAAKISALSKRFYDKKSKKSAALTVGDTPVLTPGSLESASLTTWATILTTTEALAAEHDTFSTALNTQVADVLKFIATRYEDYRKRYESLSQKLASERDSVYSDLKKAKNGYDVECKGVEEKRQKVDKCYDSSKAKAQRSYETELVEMSNVKNSYLIQIQVANRHKQRYYHEDLPEITNSLQDLNETRVAKLNSLWTLSSNIETACHQNSIGYLNAQVSEIARNLPVLDSGMFLKHNIAGWTEPADFCFEPSPIWHDNPEMVVDESAQVYLRNMLQKSRKGMEGLKAEVDKRSKEIEQLSGGWNAIKLDESQAQKEVDIVRGLVNVQEEILPHAAKLLTCQVEVDVIVNAVGDVARGIQSHAFKATTFKIPTNCDLCGERIWGLTSKGATCTDCGYSCHSKCEMKVPAACPGVLDKAAKKALRGEKKAASAAVKNGGVSETDLSGSGGLTRSNTAASNLTVGGRLGSMSGRSPSISAASMASATSIAAPPTSDTTPAVPRMTAPIMAPPPTRRVLAPPPDRYIAPPPAELAADNSPPATPTSSIHTGEPQETGKMLYAFAADGENELRVSEGVIVTILEDDGSWMTVRRPDGREGLVPTSYVEKIVVAPPTPKVGKRGPPPPVKPRGAKKERKVRALFNYSPTGEDEVAMHVGEEFVVLERDVGGWVKVKCPDGEGLVPGTYVENV